MDLCTFIWRRYGKLLNEIREALEELQHKNPEVFGEKVAYGKMKQDDVPDLWNYITFNRVQIKKSGTSLRDCNLYYQINMIHEDYIPENAVFLLIERLSKINGLKEANEDVVFDYTIKAKTDTVVEAAVILFTEPVKGYRKRGTT